MQYLRGVVGLLVIIGVAVLFSKHRKQIYWRLVVMGVLLQLLLAIGVLKLPWFRSVFEYISQFFVKIIDFTNAGADFIFGKWPSVVEVVDAEKKKPVVVGSIFVIKALPTIIFVSALTSGLYFLGVLQRVVYAMAWVMRKTMHLSGSESLAAAANVFVGQTEAPLLIRPYVAKMTESELFALMTGGMATIAGGVLAAYVSFLGGDDPQLRQEIATHLLTASLMSAPAALVIAKILIPETHKEALERDMRITMERPGTNLIDALALGAADGLKLAANVAAMLLVFIAVIAMLNDLLYSLGEWLHINPWIQQSTQGVYHGLSLQYLLGQLFRPLAFIIGVPWQESLIVGSLLGEKTAINEFVAYVSLAQLPTEALSHKARIIAIYALCGFSNFSSIAIQIGGIGGIAPNQRSQLSRLGLLSVLGGTLACLMTATIAGMLVG